jgi:hypothetical protein
LNEVLKKFSRDNIGVRNQMIKERNIKIRNRNSFGKNIKIDIIMFLLL